MVDGKNTDIDPIAAMLNQASLHEVLHMTLAAFAATGFAVAAVHAFFLLRDRNSLFHRSALGIALAVAGISIPYGLSFLLADDFDARVAGLDEFPKSEWPNVRIVHWSFDLMVASGMAL